MQYQTVDINIFEGMGSQLCKQKPEWSPQMEMEGEEVQLQNNQLTRVGTPSFGIGFNLNKLPPQLRNQEELNKMQAKIQRFTAHEKRNYRPYKIKSRKPIKKNELADPYYIRSMDAIYIGEWVYNKTLEDNVPHGIGRLYTEEDIIQGQITTTFELDADEYDLLGGDIRMTNIDGADEQIGLAIEIDAKLNGEGRIFNRQFQLRGQFLKGVLHGKGYYKCKVDGEPYQYTGQFKHGRKHGKGIEKYKLTNYEGDYENDQKCGMGMLTLLISNVYQRERLAEEGQIAVQDKQKDPADKIMRVKEFIKARKEYQALLAKELQEFKWKPPKYLSLSVLDNEYFIIERHRKTKLLQNYKGMFKNNLFEGEGTYSWFNGKCYNGFWEEGKMNGIGQFYWPKGSYYKGQYLKDCKHGKGQIIWTYGKRYRGSWAYSMRHGYGELIEVTYQDQKGDRPADVYRQYVLHVKGALWEKDNIIKTYFQVEKPIRDMKLHQLKIQEKEMIAFIKDISID